MRRRPFLAALLLSLLLQLPATQAAERVFKLGILDGGRALPPGRTYLFVRMLKSHGFEEGKNLSVVVKAANYAYDDLDRLAQELVIERPDVILAMGPSSIAAAAGATRTIPIVMYHSGDPIALGLVKDLARPGGNITGNGWEQDIGQVAKTLELLKEIAPAARRVGYVWHIQNKSLPLYEQRFLKAAGEAGLQLVSVGIRQGPELPGKLKQLEEASIDALVIIADYITLMYQKELDAIVRRRGMPTLVMGRLPGTFEHAILFYGPKMSEFPAMTAEYVARIFNGARAGDLPIVLPSQWELVLNPRAAAALGVAVPRSLVLRADELIK